MSLELASLEALEAKIVDLEAVVSERLTRVSLVVPITTFTPEPFVLLKEIKAVVQQDDEEEFTASFFDANVNASGANQVEAVEHLKDLLLSRFEFLGEQPTEQLSPPLQKQIAILREYIRPKD